MNKYSNKTVLVTGATGLIGSHIVDKLMSYGDVKVIALSRSEKKLKTGFAEYNESDMFKMVAQDICNPIQIQEPIDYIFHAAGPMEGKIIREYPVDVINPNIIGTINCLEFLKKQNKMINRDGRLILFSSVTVYGNNTNNDITVDETLTNITEYLESVSAPYSQSKRMSEVITLAYIKQYSIDAVICRFSTVYGSTRFIPDTAFFEFISKAINGDNIILNSSDLPRRDNIYIDDAVEGVLLVGTDGNIGEAYNISSNGDFDNYASVDEIAKYIISCVREDYGKRNIELIYKNNVSTKRKTGLKLDNKKVKALGWNINYSLKKGIKETLEDIINRQVYEM